LAPRSTWEQPAQPRVPALALLAPVWMTSFDPQARRALAQRPPGKRLELHWQKTKEGASGESSQFLRF